MMYFYVLLLGFVLIHGIQAEAVYSQREITVRVEPGAVECFYERAQKNQIIDFEYQGNLLSFVLKNVIFLQLKMNQIFIPQLFHL